MGVHAALLRSSRGLCRLWLSANLNEHALRCLHTAVPCSSQYAPSYQEATVSKQELEERLAPDDPRNFLPIKAMRNSQVSVSVLYFVGNVHAMPVFADPCDLSRSYGGPFHQRMFDRRQTRTGYTSGQRRTGDYQTTAVQETDETAESKGGESGERSNTESRRHWTHRNGSIQDIEQSRHQLPTIA